MKKKFFVYLGAFCMIFTSISPNTIEVRAEGKAATTTINDQQVVIENDYIKRVFDISSGHILTGEVLNKRINSALRPATGSEDFVINLINNGQDDTEDEDVIVNNPKGGVPNPLSTDGWNAVLTNAAGQYISDESVKLLFDNNLDTYPNEYKVSGNPFTLDIDFGEVKTLKAMSVNKRPGFSDSRYGTNGTMGQYEIWYSEDGEEYNKFLEGEFTAEDYNLHTVGGLHNVGDMVYVNFDKTLSTRYIRVIQNTVAFGTNQEFASAEVDFYDTEISKSKVQFEKKPTKAIDRTNWKASITNASGQAFDQAQVAKLFDGDLNTNPDEYKKAGNPITVEIDLGTTQELRSFSIDKRPGFSNAAYGINGTMGKFELYVSQNGKDWEKAGVGEFKAEAYNLHEEGGLYNVGDTVYANFYKTYRARYVRIIQMSQSLGSVQEFTSAELNLFSDQYYGPNWNTVFVPESGSNTNKDNGNGIYSSKLTYKGAVSEDTKDGKKVTISYEPYEKNGINYNINQVVVLGNDDFYMRSFLEISVDDMENAQIDYIDMDRFVLPENVKDTVWTHPDEKDIYSMWIRQYETTLGQPIYVNGMFMGSEFPAADTVVKNGTTQIRYYSGKSFKGLKADNQLTTDDKFVTWQNVIGAAQGKSVAEVQTDFFAYIEEIATPTDFRKQYNSWYDNMMTVTDESIAKSFYGVEDGLAKNGVEPLDSYVVDDGWNNYYDGTFVGPSVNAGFETSNRTGFWEFNNKFPDELYPSNDLANKFNSTFGLWVGPQGGYKFNAGFAKFLESKGTGHVQHNPSSGDVVCTGSRTYIRNLEKLFIDYQERFDIDYWKFDGFALRPCDAEDHDHAYGGYNSMYFTSDLWEAWIDLFENIRAQRAAEGKDLFINATCYVNLSPWLLQWVNTVWIQNSKDTAEAGISGDRHQRKIYYRDQVYYQMCKQNQIQFPLKNIYNHDPIYGVSDGSNATTEVFREFLFANAVRGTAFWELYFSPSIMDDAKWKVTEDALRFAEDNHEVLKNAKIFGAVPTEGVYGYSAWNGAEGIISFTNPLSTQQTFTIKADEQIGITEVVTNLSGYQVLPYKEGNLDKNLSYGDTISVTLKPNQTLIYHYGHQDTKAPELVSYKAVANNQVEIKFDERIQNVSVDVNGTKSEISLGEDYRTVIVTLNKELQNKEEVTINYSVNDFNGNNAASNVKVPYYVNGTVISVTRKADLVDGTGVEEEPYSTNDSTFLKFAGTKEIKDTSIIDTKQDFTVQFTVKTGKTNTSLFKQGNVEVSIDNDGYAIFKLGDKTISSKEEVTTVTEKAHGTFNTDEYVPTKTQTDVIGKINDKGIHTITATLELNGMMKLFVDGRLTSTYYGDINVDDNKDSRTTIGGEGFEGYIANLSVTRAVLYNETQKYYLQYNIGKEYIESEREGWTAEACSEMPGTSGDASAQAAIDGNMGSWWHTNYKGADNHKGNHWIKVNFNREETFDRFIYTGRGAEANGTIRDYKLELLAKDGSVIKEFSGEFPPEVTSVVEFGDTYSAYGFKLYVLSTQNGKDFGSAVELNVASSLEEKATDSQINEIETKFNDFDGLVSDNYTTDSYEEAKSVIDGIKAEYRATGSLSLTGKQAEKFISDIQKAFDTLVADHSSPEEKATDSQLKEIDDKLNEFAVLNSNNYTTDSYNAAKAIIDKVKAEYESTGRLNVTKEQAEKLIPNLQKALGALVADQEVAPTFVPTPEAGTGSGNHTIPIVIAVVAGVLVIAGIIIAILFKKKA